MKYRGWHRVLLIIPSLLGALVIFSLCGLIPNILRSYNYNFLALGGNLLTIPLSWFYVNWLNIKINSTYTRNFFQLNAIAIKSIFIGFLIALSIYLVSLTLLYILIHTKIAFNQTLSFKPLMFLLLTCLISATFEELIFRGLIFTTIFEVRHRFWISLIISAFLFASFHIISFNGGSAVLNFIHVFMGGIILGLLFYLLGNLWGPIILHTFFNFFNRGDLFLIEPFMFNSQQMIMYFATIIQIILILIIAICLKYNYQRVLEKT